MTGPNEFCFLNETNALESASDWNHLSWSKLWLYNLHYFDDLNADTSRQRIDWHRALIQRWIDENPATSGNGWEPYPLSLRIVNWIKWGLGGNELETAWLDSLVLQTRVLRKRLEYHLLGNHLFANAKALVFAGLYFSGDEADEWLFKGLSIIGKEIPEQILPDGGHFERSPLYHSIILEDLLDLINLAGVYGFKIDSVLTQSSVVAGERKPDGNGRDSLGKGVFKVQQQVEACVETAQKMQTWLKAMCHPDKKIAFFNDAAFDVAPKPKELETYALRLCLAEGAETRSGITHLADSGYLRIEQGPAVVLIDVAAVGPDYLPGHAHGDTLSFELALKYQRVLVNTGISTYEEGSDRNYQRGTAAHNTVVINDENSTEVWGSFRVARRARPFDLKVSELDEEITISCAHDGYRRLKGQPVHRRTWRASDNHLLVRDTIEGEWCSATAYYHFHPDVQIEEISEQGGVLHLTDGAIVRLQVDNARAEVVRGHYHPEFGLAMPNQCLKLSFTDSVCEVIFSWD